jgi:hypothetical protein
MKFASAVPRPPRADLRVAAAIGGLSKYEQVKDLKAGSEVRLNNIFVIVIVATRVQPTQGGTRLFVEVGILLQAGYTYTHPIKHRCVLL